MAKNKKYNKYKASGIEWLGDIPEHWDAKRLKLCSQIRVSNVDKKSFEYEIPVRLCNYTDVYYNEFITDDLELMNATATAEEIRKFRIQEGDVIITKDSESWDDIAVPAYVKRATPEMICGYHLAHIRPDNNTLSGKYLFRAFLSEGIEDQFKVLASGVTRFGLPKYAIDNGLFPIPPVPEQQAIAKYLDHETGRINTLIEKKQEFTNKLKEKRTALISHVVTKGLDPNVKLKPSGIEWLGDVPEHWEVKKLKYFANFKSGDNITFESISSNGDYPVFGGNGLRGYTDSFTHRGEYVLIGRQGAQCGNIHLVSGEFWASEHAVVATPCSKYNAVWFLKLLTTMNLNQYSETAAQPGLSMERIQNLKVPSPSFKEQQSIADNLSRETSKIDSLIDNVKKAIEKLQEYRSAIISAAVTGKIDVRETV